MKFHNRVEYTFGQKIGECLFINEEESVIRPNGRRRRTARFRCKCGNLFICKIEHIHTGNTKSCGCMIRGNAGKITTHGHTKGRNRSTEFIIWQGIITRCSIKDRTDRYYKRGIKICARWKNSFECFLEDMGHRPSKEHSIDRINNDGDYCPENCRWATKSEQSRNKSTNIILTFNGKTQCALDWAKELNVGSYVIYHRLNIGWSIDKTLSTPLLRKRKNKNELLS
jgi:hypothetical protein